MVGFMTLIKEEPSLETIPSAPDWKASTTKASELVHMRSSTIKEVFPLELKGGESFAPTML